MFAHFSLCQINFSGEYAPHVFLNQAAFVVTSKVVFFLKVSLERGGFAAQYEGIS